MFKNLVDDIKNLFVTKKQLNDFNFLNSLTEEDYPRILKKIVYQAVKERLNLSKPSTFIDKIQWLKLYDDNPLRQTFIDKVTVREWVEEQIGSEYLIPVYQICDDFADIKFNDLPEKFLIKANNGEKREYKIKDKARFLQVNDLVVFINQKIDYWQKTSFCPESGLEKLYKNIDFKILIEKVIDCKEELKFGVYCFNGEAKYSELIKQNFVSSCVYDENFKQVDYNFIPRVSIVFQEATEEMKKAFELSKKLSKDFKFVRVDWKILDGKLYFDRMNFSPYLGFIIFEDENWNKELGELIKI